MIGKPEELFRGWKSLITQTLDRTELALIVPNGLNPQVVERGLSVAVDSEASRLMSVAPNGA